MRNKFLATVFAVLFLTGLVFANPVVQTLISTTLLTNETNSTSGQAYIQDMERPCIGVTFVKALTTGNITIGMNGTFDGTNYFPVYWHTIANTTLINNDTLTTNQTYFMELDPNWSIPIVNLTILSNSGNLTSTANVTALIAGTK